MTRTNASGPRADRGFVIRTPLLPLEVFAEWAAAADPRQYLVELVQRPEIREALFVASPSLFDAIARWQREPESPTTEPVGLAITRYIARMAGRATPFGLFSGVSTGSLAKETSLQLAPRAEYRRRTRIDNDYLFALVEELARRPEVRDRVRYRPNTSLYSASGRLRYAEARLVERTRTYHLVSVDPTAYLLATLERCQTGARLTELAAGIVADDPEVTLEEAAAYLDELVAAQILVPELGVAVTGAEPIDVLLDQLAAASLDEPARVLAAARDRIAALDASGLGNAPDTYVTVARTLEQLPAQVEQSRLLQVDMVKPASATLGTKVAAMVLRTIEWLRQIQRPSPSTALDEFRSAFVERYEQREVPLVKALDEEAGIGFEPGFAPGAEGSPLLANVRFPARPPIERVAWSRVERHMQRRLAAALGAGADEIELDDSDQKAMQNDEPPPLPDAFHAIIRIEQASDGEPSVLFGNASGPSGVRLLGRFCHASPEVESMVREHLRAEEALRPDAVFAEVVHLNEGRIGNIVCRPVLRDHEIVFLGMSGAPRERQLAIDDLMLSVRDNRIVLTSRRLGTEVIPRLTTAHNFRQRSLGIYRFLCALQSESATVWSWGALAGMPFLPRVRIGRVTVSRATWNLGAAELEPITQVVRAMSGKAARALSLVDRRGKIEAVITALRDRLRLPRFVVIAESDHELPIDLDNPQLLRVLADEAAGRQAMQLVELFPAFGMSPVRSAEGSFANELVLSFVRPAPAASTVTVDAKSRATANARRSFPPGSSWLYAKLYTGPTSADRVLREAIAPLVRDVIGRGDASHWFFLRYRDTGNHLRVRLAGDPVRLTAAVLPALERAIAHLREDGSIWKVQLDTYEREIERYGGDRGIELCEQLFWIDSEAVLGLVELLDGDAAADARWRLALRGSESLLEVLGLDPDARHRVFTTARDAFGREHGVDASFYAPIGEQFKRERDALETLFVRDPARDEKHDLAPGLAILAERDARLQSVAAVLRERDAAGELAPKLHGLAWSLVHMHVNRLLHASHRAQELVLYDLLRRLHETRRARARAKPEST